MAAAIWAAAMSIEPNPLRGETPLPLVGSEQSFDILDLVDVATMLLNHASVWRSLNDDGASPAHIAAAQEETRGSIACAVGVLLGLRRQLATDSADPSEAPDLVRELKASCYCANADDLEQDESVTCVSCNAAAALTAQAAEIERLREARLDDLRKLLNALYLGDHARPIHPAEVFQQCLDEIAQVQKEMRAMAHELNALGGKPLSAWKRGEP